MKQMKGKGIIKTLWLSFIVDKKIILTLVMVTIFSTGIFSYENGLFDLDYNGNLLAIFHVIEFESNGKPGLASCEDIMKEWTKSKKGIKSYNKITLPQKGINAAFKVIKDEGYSTSAYKVYMISFYKYSFSNRGVNVFMKFDKDGSAWIDAYESFTD